ncbi:MAG: hypothetical protein ACYCQI_10100 [Gammaproteobacteria bacterium]
MLRNETMFESKESESEINKISHAPSEAQLDAVFDPAVDSGEWQDTGRLSENRLRNMNLKLEDILNEKKQRSDRLMRQARRDLWIQNKELFAEVKKLRQIQQDHQDLLDHKKELHKEFVGAAKDGMKQEQERREVTQAYYEEMKESDRRQAKLDDALEQLTFANEDIEDLQDELQDQHNIAANLKEDLQAEQNKTAQLESELQKASATIALLQRQLFMYGLEARFIAERNAYLNQLQAGERERIAHELQEGQSAKHLLSAVVQALHESMTNCHNLMNIVEDQKQIMERWQERRETEKLQAEDKIEHMAKRTTALKQMLDASLKPMLEASTSTARSGMFGRPARIQSFETLADALEYKSPKAGM